MQSPFQAHLSDEGLHHVQYFLYGRLCVKAGGAVLKLVMQEGLHALRQSEALCLQPVLLLLHGLRVLLQGLVVPMCTHIS